MIVAADVVRDTNDSQQLQPMLTQAVAHTEVRPEHVLVDTGYENIRQVIAVEEQFGTQVLCPPAVIDRAGRGRVARSRWGRQRKAKRLNFAPGTKRRLARSLCRTAHHRQPAIGIIKSALGFVRFRLRGLHQDKNEWNLVSLAFNCRRLARARV